MKKMIGYFFFLILILLAHVWKESKLAEYSIELNRLKEEKEMLISEREQLLGRLAVEASVVEMEKKALDLGFVFPTKEDIAQVWRR